MHSRLRPLSMAVASFVVGGLLAVPVVGLGHCSPTRGLIEAVVLTVTEDADFYSSTNHINTDSMQTWGAPWCQITDSHYVQRYESGGWVRKAYKSWTSYKSVDSGWHPGVRRVWDFYSLSNGSWRFQNSAYRVASHNQLFNSEAGDYFDHMYDIDTTYQSGSL